MNNTRVVWRGTYTNKSGRRTNAVIRIDPEKLADYFGYSRHSGSAFSKAHENGRARTTRLHGGVIIDLTPGTDEERTEE